MAKVSIDPRVQAIVDMLPATGEISYDQWKADLANAGKYDQIRLTRIAKNAGLVQFRNEIDAQGNLSLLVGRAPSGGKA